MSYKNYEIYAKYVENKWMNKQTLYTIVLKKKILIIQKAIFTKKKKKRLSVI